MIDLSDKRARKKKPGAKGGGGVEPPNTPPPSYAPDYTTCIITIFFSVSSFSDALESERHAWIPLADLR